MTQHTKSAPRWRMVGASALALMSTAACGGGGSGSDQSSAAHPSNAPASVKPTSVAPSTDTTMPETTSATAPVPAKTLTSVAAPQQPAKTVTTMPTTTASSGSYLTQQQQNAVSTAKTYLSLEGGFSRSELIGQLDSKEGDQYSPADATAAVDSLKVNWNAQAVKAAKSYMKISPMSCTAMREQLSSSYADQFTPAQAAYGAEHSSACAR